nr:PREDICTED: uncharacterized protein LOC109030943 [Bemisia tabaci]
MYCKRRENQLISCSVVCLFLIDGDMFHLRFGVLSCLVLVVLTGDSDAFKIKTVKTKCPAVRSLRNFNLEELAGYWYVIDYYAMSEEELSFRCMQAEFTVSPPPDWTVSMYFTYSYKDDPEKEVLFGNITWRIPDRKQLAHWIHAEDIYEGVYNTYVLDSDYKSWTLLLHCAEKTGSPRYLSSFILSKEPQLPENVINFLRDKLPRYDVDLEYMFHMEQTHCANPDRVLHYGSGLTNSVQKSARRHPLQRTHE